jgi:putative transposase
MRETAAFYIQRGFKVLMTKVLMTNPVHPLVTPCGPRSLPRTMQSLGRRTVRPIHARVRPTGREGSYRAASIDSEACFLACCRTIALNEVACAHGPASPR